MKNCLLILIAMAAIFQTQAKVPVLSETLHILSRESYNPKVFALSDSDWRWLGNKRELNVAVWQPEIPPLNLYTGEERYEGMIADYVHLVAQYLGLRVHVVLFADRNAALDALSRHDVDMIADPSGKALASLRHFTTSTNFISDHPVLVHRKTVSNAPFSFRAGMQLAIARWYVDDSWIEKNFPDVKIVHFESDEQAMASVAFGENDFYIGNLVTTSWLMERNYAQLLRFQQVYPERDTGSHFVMRQGDSILLRAVNRALEAIPRSQNQVILQQWSERANLWHVSKQVEFTTAEKKWLAKNPLVNVSVNAFYAPFTMIDADGNFYGVTADILRLIKLRTGINFEPVSADSINTMEQQLASKKAAFIGAVSHSEERNQNLLFSRAYFTSPFVLIEPKDKKLPSPLPPGTRVAVVSKNSLIEELQQANPGIEIIETANASIAMQRVDDGTADAAVHTLFGANYMIDRYFGKRLKIGGQIGARTADIAFAVSRDQPELSGILNKSLANISPADINSIITKWQTRPDVRLDTWELYKTQFWLVLSVAGFIILTSLVWIYYLRREVRARRLAQQKLQSQLAHNQALSRALSEERERAEQANRAKSTFLATMSHEIRTPVSAIIGLLELAVNTGEQQPAADDPVRVAWESAQSLMGLIGDILDMARIESGRLELAAEWIKTTDLLPPIVRVFEGLARQKSLRLRCTFSSQLPYQVFIDPLRFRQILSNLVSNAIKFTEQGCVNVDMVVLEGEMPDRAVLKICVSDTGKGITQDEQQDIFDPWVQAKSNPVQNGSGLGLAICAQLVNMMGGQIAMKSLVGEGTQVTFTVPVEQSEKRPEQPLSLVAEVPASRRSLHILAVDDHPANRMLLRRQLMHLGHRVTEAKDGAEALTLWKKGNFELVITDCSMPEMDGLALTRHIREIQPNDVVILGLTANASQQERIRCLAAGMNDCLFKPLQLPQLEVILHQVMQHSAGETSDEETSDGELLKSLIDYEKLYALSNGDENMLRELLRLTWQTNVADLAHAEDLVELHDWPELAKCLHSMSGAAQISGARRTESACRKMEEACREVMPDETILMPLWLEVSASVQEFDQAIEAWLG